MSSTLRKSDESELQERNGQEHLRVYDPAVSELLKEVLSQLKEMNFHLRNITGEYGYED